MKLKDYGPSIITLTQGTWDRSKWNTIVKKCKCGNDLRVGDYEGIKTNKGHFDYCSKCEYISKRWWE